MESCIFSKVDKCGCPDSSDLITVGPQRIATIINRSKLYEDNLFQELEENLQSDSNYFVHTHKACVSTYTTKHYIARFLKRKGRDAIDTCISPKKTRC